MVMMPHAERSEHALFRKLGVEPLSEELTADYLASKARGKKVNLKAFLMDQHVIAGLGNIYVSEALFQAGLSPNRAAASLANRRGAPSERAAKLVVAIKDVLERAIAAGGSTLRDYRHANGDKGAFQERFAVYDRAGSICLTPQCGGKIRRAVHAGRATFYCQRCQR
jgi:formamidopyrimidine-DNA glycosylase